jgi:hypothetical protein
MRGDGGPPGSGLRLTQVLGGWLARSPGGAGGAAQKAVRARPQTAAPAVKIV